MNNAVKSFAAAAAFTLLAGAAFAQTPPPPPHRGILSRLFHPKPRPTISQMHPGMAPSHYGTTGAHSYSTMGSRPMMGGQIIGNKNTHVFHMPGDRSALPAAQNRVYFPSAAAAQAAGYHAAGGSHAMMRR